MFIFFSRILAVYVSSFFHKCCILYPYLYPFPNPCPYTCLILCPYSCFLDTGLDLELIFSFIVFVKESRLLESESYVKLPILDYLFF